MPSVSKALVLDDDFFGNLKKKLHDFFEKGSSLRPYDLISHQNGHKKKAPFLPKRISIALDTGSMDAIQFFSLFNCPEKILWSSRDDDSVFLIFGFMKRFKSSEVKTIQKNFKEHGLHDHKIYGSFLFEGSKKTAAPWQGFTNRSWVFPRFEFISPKKGARLNLYYQDHKKNEIWRELKKLEVSYKKKAPSLQGSAKRGKKAGLTYLPEKKEWISKVHKVKKLIQNEELKKLVLARTIRLNTGRIDTDHLLNGLCPSFTDHYIFIYQTDPKNIFVSFSPERLFKRKGNFIYTEAVAGSKKITDGNKNARSIKDPKNIMEQKIVEQEIIKIMEKITKEYTIDQKQKPVRYKYIEHIRSAFTGVLKSNYSDAKLLELFHPTSAVCGLPREISKKQINRLEKFKRGLYASPLGYISDQESELCVGIRSLLIRKKNTFIFSGAGITDDSSPEQEWEELDYKIKPFLNFFGF